MADFSDDFSTDPDSRWTDLFNAAVWDNVNYRYVTASSGGSYSYYNTSTGGVTQYVKFQLTSGDCGAVFRSTGTASDGFYVCLAWGTGSAVYFQRANDTGYLADMASGSLSTTTNDYIGITLQGTGANTYAKFWLNPTNDTPYSADYWDNDSDGPDVTLQATGGTYYDTGQYVGFGVDSNSRSIDNWYGGSISGIISGTTCWGHSTGVEEDNTKTFTGNGSGTATISGSGDSEVLIIAPGEYWNFNTISTDGAQSNVTITLGKYVSGGNTVTKKYRTGTTQAECEAASFSTYSGPVSSTGFFQARLEG